jgi:hypothetical protein
MSNSIPVMRSPADLMNHGPNSDNLAAAAVQMHPIDRLQRGKSTLETRRVKTIFFFTFHLN